MKPNNTLLKVLTIFITLIAISLWIEVRRLGVRLDEETQLKYENSYIIDSLIRKYEGK